MQHTRMVLAVLVGGVASCSDDGAEIALDAIGAETDLVDGRVAIQRQFGDDLQIWLANDDGSNLTQLVESSGVDGDPAWTPDGRRIVFTSTRDGSDDIYIMDADGSNQRRLTDHPGSESHPAVSPDGASIAFQGKRDIHVMDLDGGNPRNLTGTLAGSFGAPDWSPDGTRIATNGICVIDADGGDLIDLTPDATSIDVSPAWSPDGTAIAFASNRAGAGLDIFVMNADGSDLRRLTTTPADDDVPAWSRHGEYIYFDSMRDGNRELYVMRADGSEPRRLTVTTGTAERFPAPSPVRCDGPLLFEPGHPAFIACHADD